MKREQLRTFKSNNLVLKLSDKYLNIVTKNLKRKTVDGLNQNLIFLWELKMHVKNKIV